MIASVLSHPWLHVPALWQQADVHLVIGQWIYGHRHLDGINLDAHQHNGLYGHLWWIFCCCLLWKSCLSGHISLSWIYAWMDYLWCCTFLPQGWWTLPNLPWWPGWTVSCHNWNNHGGSEVGLPGDWHGEESCLQRWWGRLPHLHFLSLKLW